MNIYFSCSHMRLANLFTGIYMKKFCKSICSERLVHTCACTYHPTAPPKHLHMEIWWSSTYSLWIDPSSSNIHIKFSNGYSNTLNPKISKAQNTAPICHHYHVNLSSKNKSHDKPPNKKYSLLSRFDCNELRMKQGQRYLERTPLCKWKGRITANPCWDHYLYRFKTCSHKEEIFPRYPNSTNFYKEVSSEILHEHD